MSLKMCIIGAIPPHTHECWHNACIYVNLIVLEFNGMVKLYQFKRPNDQDHNQILQEIANSIWYSVFPHLSHVTRKSICGVCDLVRLKLACSATETS